VSPDPLLAQNGGGQPRVREREHSSWAEETKKRSKSDTVGVRGASHRFIAKKKKGGGGRGGGGGGGGGMSQAKFGLKNEKTSQ